MTSHPRFIALERGRLVPSLRSRYRSNKPLNPAKLFRPRPSPHPSPEPRSPRGNTPDGRGGSLSHQSKQSTKQSPSPTEDTAMAHRSPWERAGVRAKITTLALSSLLLALSSPAAELPSVELWFPSKDLAAIQKAHPNAVNLTPEQYQTLIRDAAKTLPPEDPKLKPPAEATVERIVFRTTIDPAQDTALFTGEVIVRSLTDQWTQLDIRLPFPAVTSATAEHPHLALSPADKDNIRHILLRGKGTHTLHLEALAPITTLNEAGKQSLPFHVSPHPGELQIQLPPEATVINRELSLRTEGTLVHIPLNQPASQGQRIVNWSTGDLTMQRRILGKEANAALITLTEQTLTATWALTLEKLGTAPTERTVLLSILPADTVIENITGDLLKQWKPLGSGQVELTIAANHGTSARLDLTLSTPLNIADTAQPISIPIVRSPEQITQSYHATLATLDPDLALLEQRGNLATWQPTDPAPQLILRKAKPRIIADADTLVTVTKDDLKLERTLALSTDRALNELRVTLPPDEQFDDTVQTQGPAFEWKRIGQTLEYRWPTSLTAAAPSKITLRSSKPLSKGEPRTENISPITIPEAAKQTGYLALNYDTTWRITLTDTTGLEERDVKLTPVKGRMAWFSLRSFKLGLTLQRRDPVIDTQVIAYALPRARSIDIEGLLQLTVSESPLRQFAVRFDKTAAPQVRFTSDNIAERHLDEPTGEWTLTLRQETLGSVPIRWALSLPSIPDSGILNPDSPSNTPVPPAEPNQKSGIKNQESGIRNQKSTFPLPTIALPTARRFTAAWVIEANTDTEISFAPKQMQPLDVLHAPLIPGYQPRHRLVGAYTYAAPEASLTLTAARHGHSELAALIVQQLALRSVLALDGSTRHQATLSVQHSGEQYLTLALPPTATLLSVLAAGNPVKPVRGPDSTLSIPLPATSANQPQVQLTLLYETTDPPWLPTGQRKLHPPTIPGNVPILSTDWQVFTPDGYSFKKANTNLDQEGTGLPTADWAEAIGRLSPIGPMSQSLPADLQRGGVANADMEEIHPKFPKPMFVGTPVPAPGGFNLVDPGPSEFQRKMDAENPIEQAKNRKRNSTLAKTSPLKKVVSTSANSSSSLPDVPPALIELPSAPDAKLTEKQVAKSEEDRVKDILLAMPINGIVRDSDGSVRRVMLGNIPLEKGQIVPPVIPDQVVVLRVNSLSDTTLELVFIVKNKHAGLPPRPFIIPVNSRPQVRYTLPSTGRGNTSWIDLNEPGKELLDLFKPSDAPTKSGLLTLALDLPTTGQRLHFHGLQAPTSLDLNYRSWERQFTIALLLMGIGAGLFVALGRRRPVMLTLLAILVLGLGVSLLVEEWQTLGNALLIGWLAAAALALISRSVQIISTRITQRRLA